MGAYGKCGHGHGSFLDGYLVKGKGYFSEEKHEEKKG
jgi:hypothetical protein